VFGKEEQRPSILHIMVLLKYLGSYGNEASLQKIGQAMGISKCAVNECVMWASSAILKLQKKVISWPEDEEWKRISARISKAHGFVNCVGLIDGTLFPLAFAPMLKGEDYFTRKGKYQVKGLIICDAKITWVEMGWPGSVHDNWVWSNSDVNLLKDKYFNNRKYLLGGSAFSASSVLVPAFKKGNDSNLK